MVSYPTNLPLLPILYVTRNKQVVAARLAVAGLAVAYEMDSYPTNGPFPSIISLAVSKASHGNTWISVGFFI